MKRRWLTVLLAVSLAGNLVELGLFAHRAWARRRGLQEFFEDLAARAPRCNLHVLGSGREAELDSLGYEELRLQRRLLLAEMAAVPDSAELARIAEQMAGINRSRYRLVFESRQAVAALPDSAERSKLVLRWRLMTGILPDSGH